MVKYGIIFLVSTNAIKEMISMRRRYSEEEKRKAIEMYKKGVKTKDISDILQIPETNIVRWAKEAGLSRLNRLTKSQIEKLKPKIKELYESGKTFQEVADELNLTYRQVEHMIEQMRIARHKGPQSKIKREDYFDVIDTEDKAYWLGWIMADGNVSITNGQYSLKLHISLEDRVLIDSFLEFIGSTNKPRINTKNNKGGLAYYVSLTSVHMVKRLIELGVVPRKSGKEIIPDDVPKELRKHFIRGYFDGDGITCVTDKNLRSGFIGSKQILEQIQKELNVSYVIFNASNSKAYYFTGGIQFSKKLYEYMYKDANLWLERKRQRMGIICGNTEVTNRPKNLLAP
jgi:transposase-like protein